MLPWPVVKACTRGDTWCGMKVAGRWGVGLGDVDGRRGRDVISNNNNNNACLIGMVLEHVSKFLF